MKKEVIVSMVLAIVTAATATAQITVNMDVFGRYQINNAFTVDPAPEVNPGSWGPGQGTLGGTPNSGTAVWAQLLQFNAGAEAVAFGAATSFELTVGPDLQNEGRAYDVFVGAGTTNFSGFAAGTNIVGNSGVGLGGVQVATGLTSGGSFTLSNAALDSFLGGVDFVATPYIYFTFRPHEGTAVGTVNLSGSTLTAVPEPSHYAAILGLLGLTFVWLRRRGGKR